MKKTLISLLSKNKFDRILIIIYVLNIFDYLFTLVLVSSGLFIEANPFLSTDIQGVGGFILKCGLPLILLSYLHIRFSVSAVKNEKTAKTLLYLILSYYALINIFHLFWLCWTVVMFI